MCNTAARATRWLAVVVVIASIGGGSFHLIRRRDEPAIVRLHRAASELPHRITTARLVGFPYAPPLAPKRGDDKLDTALLVARGTAGEVLRDGSRDPYTLAIAELIAGDAEAAQRRLEKSVAGNNATASMWSDLAAVRYERGLSGDVESLAGALAAADEALRIDANLIEASFNRALALEALQLLGFAAAAFRDVIKREQRPEWRAEAESRLAKLPTTTLSHEWKASAQPRLEQACVDGDRNTARGIVKNFTQSARTHVEGIYTATWAEATASGRTTDAERALTIARCLANALFEVNGDTLMRDAMAVIDRARLDPATTQRLAAAYPSYRNARMRQSARLIDEAIPLIESAERDFRAANSPMQLVARLCRGVMRTDQHRPEESLATLDAIERQAAQSHLALRAQLLWEKGRILGRMGHLYEYLETTSAASELFARLGEPDGHARMLADVAVVRMRLGRTKDAWPLLQQAFALADRWGHPSLLEAVLHPAASELLVAGRPDIADSLFALQLQMPGKPTFQLEAMRQRALRSGRVDFAALRRHVEEAVKAEALRDDMLDEIRFAEATRASDPARAEQLLTECLEGRAAAGRRVRLHEVLVARAHARQRSGNLAGAAADLRDALAFMEQQRGEVEAELLRDAFSATAESTCNQLVDLLATQGREEEAFEAAERCSARLLLDRMEIADPLTASEVRGAIGPDVALLHYVPLRDRTIIFAVHGGQLRTFVSQTGAARMAELASDAQRRIERGSTGAIDAATRALFRAALAPAVEVLRPGTTLVIVAGGPASGIPFTALRNGDRYLVEDHTLIHAPSASAAILGSRATPWPRRPRLLLVSDPAFDAKRFPRLERLPEAQREAEVIAPLYAQTALLDGAAATVARWEQEVPKSDAVHMGAHALVDERDRWTSAIVLAPDRGDGGLLYLRDIATLRLRRAPLVVLAGCRTGDTAGGSGALRSLAFAFLVAGSRGAVATLWDAGDTSARAVSTRFHRHLTTPLPPAVALRNTQLEMLRSSDPALRTPSAWSGFQYYGTLKGEEQ